MLSALSAQSRRTAIAIRLNYYWRGWENKKATIMKLEEYSNLVQKESFFETNNVHTYKEFDSIYEDLKMQTLLYRGIHEARYKIYTSAQREWITNEYSNQGITFTQFIQSIITNIRQNTILSKYYKSLNINENDLLYISLLQHYGAPSPLLDFTHSLNIALYFALEGMSIVSSNNDIDNYFSLYIIDRNKCGNELVDIVSFLDHGLENGTALLEDFKTQHPNIDLDYSLLKDVDKYTKWIKQDGTNDGLCKMNCGFLDNPLNTDSIAMYETKDFLYWSNINLIAQQGCFILYTKESTPLEQYFSDENYLPKLRCINVHKSLSEYIKSKYLKSMSRLDIYPDINLMCKDAYGNFKKVFR